MRRHDLEITDIQEIETFIKEQRWGLLSMTGNDGYPYSVPLNYLYWNNRIYVHSAPEGKKVDLLTEPSPVQFTVVKEYAYIPSYVAGSKMACSASQFFKSVMIFGYAEIMRNDEEKAKVFTQMMKAFQPEENYQPLTPISMEYAKMLERTCLIAVTPDKISAKFKFGQGATSETMERTVAFLEKRNLPLDRETVENIRKYRNNPS